VKRLVALLLVCSAAPVGAQIGAHANASRGFEPGKAYAVGEIDSVNLYNGNLSVQIPVGQRYPVSEKVSWGLTLVYNSKLWDVEEVFDPLSGWLTRMVAGKDFNAGLGWRMSPGEIDLTDAAIHLYAYVAPDGSRHVFADRLHTNSPSTPGIYYTTDGTYLRYHEANRTLEFPDGTIHRFGSDGTLTAIHDRYWVDTNGNGVPQIGEPGGWVRFTITDINWQILDAHGRQATVTLANGQITQASLPGVGGVPEVWNLAISDERTLARACPHNVDSSGVRVRLLESVSSPGNQAVYTMTLYNQPAHQAGSCDDSSGLLRKLKLPTQGTLEWDFGLYRRPDGTGGERFCRAAFTNSLGVTARRKVQSATWGPTETQLYSPELEGATLPCTGGVPNTNVKEARTRVKQLTGTGTTPPGHETVHYFSVAIEDDAAGWREAEFGLPFSRLWPDNGGRFLSRKIVPDGATKAIQEHYVLYHTDGDTGGNPGSNPRVKSERTAWPSQTVGSTAVTYADVTRSDFDGLGNFRTETTGGNFDSANVRTTTTSWNPTRGIYPGSFVLPAPGDPWVLGTFDETTVTEGSDVDKVHYCFDADKGVLLRHRALEGTAAGSADVIRVLARNALGLVTQESEYGGDLQTVTSSGASGLCALGLPAVPSYRTDSTYTAGVLATVEPKTGAGASIGFKTVNRVVDTATGLVTAETDATGITTTYAYDALHRRITAVPPATEDAWVSHVYVAATASSKARLSIVTKTHPAPQATLTKEDFYFDGFGRLVEERRLLPGGVTTKRFTSYDVAGRVATQSVWSTVAAPPVTRFENYDALGRPGRRVLPDGKTEFLFYDGSRARSRQYKVGTTWNAASGQVVESDVGAGEIFDRQGRLWKVQEPKLTSASGVETTEYAYDAGGRLRRVDQGVQVRTFNYDGRGFLISEAHPELGGDLGGGAITYSRYDARGNVGRRVDGPWELETVYDGFGRPTKVEEVLGLSSRRTWKEWSYGTGQTATDRSAGKIVTDTRHNWLILPWSGFENHVVVTESWDYAGRSGRASSRTTSIDAGNQSYSQAFWWDELGNLAWESYPVCGHTTCTSSGAAVPRTQSYTYSNGLLTAVPGFGSLTYHPNGLVATVSHTNNVTDTIAMDGSGLPRPGSISTSGALGANWVSGAYAYDGAGNLVKMGTDHFLYDARSRVTLGRIGDGGVEKKQSYGFDRYGNLLSTTTQVGTGAPITRTNATVERTNRLDPVAATYDTAGNTTLVLGKPYTYDPFHRITTVPGNRVWVYGPGDERLWTVRYGNPGDPGTLTEIYFLRGLDNRVRREYFEIGGNAKGKWSIGKDYVYRDGQLLAAYVPSIDQTLHYSLDHLGTPRLLTDGTGTKLALHHYYPFGEEATNPNQDAERMRFTGHERDLLESGTTDDLDYMHARWCSPMTGRFLSVDPVFSGRALQQPQAWNRYAYVIGNPLKYVDPQGELWFQINGRWTYLEGVNSRTEESKDENGNLVVTVTAGRDQFLTFDGGILTLYGKNGSIRSFLAVSGEVDSNGRTQPGLQGVRDRGPIPEGRYTLNPAAVQSFADLTVAQKAASLLPTKPVKVGSWPGGVVAWGVMRAELQAVQGTNTYGREHFFVHGGSVPGSAGCIDLCNGEVEFFSALGGGGYEVLLEVDYP
jgi:RHS repeat-associated protein